MRVKLRNIFILHAINMFCEMSDLFESRAFYSWTQKCFWNTIFFCIRYRWYKILWLVLVYMHSLKTIRLFETLIMWKNSKLHGPYEWKLWERTIFIVSWEYSWEFGVKSTSRCENSCMLQWLWKISVVINCSKLKFLRNSFNCLWSNISSFSIFRKACRYSL